jgi:[NiFe] hydrogenase diaphorase moiety small subunit
MKNTKAKKKLVDITIDGHSFKVREGQNLVDAAKENGIFIPSLCYFKHHEYPLGTCRVCTCKVNGNYLPACIQKTKDGMSVEVNTDELNDIRHALVEMMFAEGNHFCPSCEKSGNCDLQHMGYELVVTHNRFPHLFKDRLIDYNPKRMILENNRCIKCRRCVEEVFTDDRKRVFMYQNRGIDTMVAIDYEQEGKLSDQQAEAAMAICPTGAIIVRGKSLAEPFGLRNFDMQSAQEDFGLRWPSKAAKKKMEKKTVATVSLAGCFGCHMSILDIDDKILDLVDLISFNKSPLTDIKDFTQQCDLGIIEGSCCNTENIETLRKFRKNCDILVSIGECAIWGGLPAMRNTIPLGECLEEAFINVKTNDNEGIIPYHNDLPKLLDRVYPCNEIVKIDYFIPGCPPSDDHIWKAIRNILWNEGFSVLYHEFKYD